MVLVLPLQLPVRLHEVLEAWEAGEVGEVGEAWEVWEVTGGAMSATAMTTTRIIVAAIFFEASKLTESSGTAIRLFVPDFRPRFTRK